MKPTLGYWNFRGLGESIRYLFVYKGLEFEDKRYSRLDEWNSDKRNLGLDFPSLPYYIDEEVGLTQSLAILRYLAKKHGLAAGGTEDPLIEMIEQEIVELRTSFIQTIYSITYDTARMNFIYSLAHCLKRLSTFLGEKKFLMGDNLTYVDFLSYDTFDYIEMLHPTVYNEFPNIKNYLRNFENLPELQSHFKSSSYKRWPIFSVLSNFGGSGEAPQKIP